MKRILWLSVLLLVGCNDVMKIQPPADTAHMKIDCTDSMGHKIVHMKVGGAYFQDGSVITKLVDTKTMLPPSNCIISNEVHNESN